MKLSTHRGVLAFLALSILTAGCAAESNDPGPSSPTPPIVADESPAPPAETNATNADPAPTATTPDSAPASASANDANVVPAPNPAFVPSTKKTDSCRLACALCEQAGNPFECATCHSVECR